MNPNFKYKDMKEILSKTNLDKMCKEAETQLKEMECKRDLKKEAIIRDINVIDAMMPFKKKAGKTKEVISMLRKREELLKELK